MHAEGVLCKCHVHNFKRFVDGLQSVKVYTLIQVISANKNVHGKSVKYKPNF